MGGELGFGRGLVGGGERGIEKTANTIGNFYATTTKTAVRLVQNNKFKQESNASACAFYIFLHFSAVLRKTTLKDQIQSFVKNVRDTA